MKINFRHGLISYQRVSATPLYLEPSSTANYVSLIVSPLPFVATIAHGSTDYLIKFDQTVDAAWGPVQAGITSYLYIEMDQLTGAVSFGSTTIEPTAGIEPASPAPGQMWFDQSKTTMMVRDPNNTKWLPSLRLVVGVALNGSTATLVPFSIGSTVGLNTEGNPGYLMLDHLLRPIRLSSGELLTTDSEVRAVLTQSNTSGVQSNPINDFIPVWAAEPIPAMRLVRISGEDQISLCGPTQPPLGLVEFPLAATEIGTVIQSGEVSNSAWDWSAHIAQPLYCGDLGELTAVRPSLSAYRVGFVKNATTIVLAIDAEAISGGPGGGGTTTVQAIAPIVATTSGDVVTVSALVATPSSSGVMSAAQAALLADLDALTAQHTAAIADLDATKAEASALAALEAAIDLKADLNHTQPISSVTGLQAALDALTASLAGKADVGHAHAIADVTGLQAALDGLTTSLAGKADVGHIHAIADVTGLQAALDALGNQAPAVHTHAISDVTDLQNTLDGKLALTGGVMSGFITLHADPTNNFHPATKQYVDGIAATVGVYTAGTGVFISPSKVISIGQDVSPSASPTFTNTVITGNLTVQGTTTTIASASLDVGNSQITLNANETGTPTQNGSFVIERGTSPDVAMRWNEALDRWEFTNDGTTYNPIIGSAAQLGITQYTDSMADARIAAASLDALADVNVPGPLTNGHVLTWNAGTSQWVAAASSGGVTSVNTLTGAVSLSTTNIPEGTNQYYTNARARSAISVSGAGLAYNSTTGVLSLSGAGVVTSVAASGGVTGLTFTGSPITSSGTLTLGGTLAVASGGTGATTAAGALTNLLPTQTGNAGKILSTDGTNVSWATAPSSVAGSTTQVMFNNAGVLAGNAGLTFNPTTTTLTATNIAGSGTAITGLNASNLASGTVATARLGTGTANSTSFLRGDNTWAVPTALVDLVVATGSLSTPSSLTKAVHVGLAPSSGFPSVYFTNPAAAADNRISGFYYDNSGSLRYALYGDSTGSATVFQIDRSLNVATNITLTATSINLAAGAGGLKLNGNAGTAGQVLTSNGVAAPTWTTIAASTPGGSTTQVQYNNAGAFAGSASFTWNSTTNTLSATNLAGAGTLITALNGSNISTGTVPVARLGSGTPTASNFLRGDGTWASPAALVPYDIGLGYTGVAAAGNVAIFVANRAFTIPAGSTNAVARAITAPNATTTFNLIKRSGTTNTTFGTVSFASAATTGSVSIGTATTFASGDFIILNLPTANTVLADVGVTLTATI